MIDVGDRPLLPGFIDVHAHAEVACRAAYGTVDCRAPECSNVGEVLEALRTGLDAAAETGWMRRAGEPLLRPKAARAAAADAGGARQRVGRRRHRAARRRAHHGAQHEGARAGRHRPRPRRRPTHSITGKPIIERDDDREPTGVVKEMDNVLPLPPQTPAVVRDALRTGIRDAVHAARRDDDRRDLRDDRGAVGHGRPGARAARSARGSARTCGRPARCRSSRRSSGAATCGCAPARSTSACRA